MLKPLSLVFIAILGTTSLKAQEPRALAPKGLADTQPLPTPMPQPSAETRSVSDAYAWAVGSTVGPIVLAGLLARGNVPDNLLAIGSFAAFSGFLFGPSAGEFYAGSQATAWLSTGMRGAGAFIAFVNFVELIGNGFCESSYDDAGGGTRRSCGDNSSDAGIWLGVGLFTAGTVFSFVDTKFAVDRYNAKHRRASLGWTPTLIREKATSFTPGLLAWVSL